MSTISIRQLKNLKSYTKIKSVLGDVRDEKISKIFKEYKPDIVFHSAALKHITFAEDDPIGRININFLGTLNILNACKEFKVNKMVFISTDKAVNPLHLWEQQRDYVKSISNN